MMNILNGGVHAKNDLDVQEVMIVPEGFDSFAEALRAGSEIYHALGKILSEKGLSTSVGDEGGYAPMIGELSDALDCIVRKLYTNKVVHILILKLYLEILDRCRIDILYLH